MMILFYVHVFFDFLKGVEAWESLRSKVSDVGHTPQTLLLISENLLGLERSISRVHLKPPLRDK